MLEEASSCCRPLTCLERANQAILSENLQYQEGEQEEGITLFYTKVGKTVKQLTSVAKLPLPAVVPDFRWPEHWGELQTPRHHRHPHGSGPSLHLLTVNSDQHRVGTSSGPSSADTLQMCHLRTFTPGPSPGLSSVSITCGII